MKKRIIYIAVLSVLLAACGGGDSSSSPIPQNKTFNVSASIASGEGAVTPPQQSIEQGKTTILNLSPKDGYKIQSATGCNGTLKDSVYTTGVINADCQIKVNFAPLIDLNVPSELEINSAFKSNLKDLTPDWDSKVTEIDTTQLSFAGNPKLVLDDVFIVKEKAYKVVSIKGDTVGNTIVSVKRPELNEIYEKIEVSGKMDALEIIPNAEFLEPQARAATNPAQHKIFVNTQEDGFFVAQYSMSKNFKPYLTGSGSLKVGAKADFNKWDIISNKGQGIVDIYLNPSFLLSLKKSDTFNKDYDKGVCSSKDEILKDGRVRLVTIPLGKALEKTPQGKVLLALTDVNIPVCLPVNVSSDMKYDLINLSGKYQTKVTLGNQSSPKINHQNNLKVEMPPSTATLSDATFEGSSKKMYSVEVKAEAGVEVGLEVVDKLGEFAHVGVNVAALARPELKGTFGIDLVGKNFSKLELEPEACLELKAQANLESKAFTQFFWNNEPLTAIGKVPFMEPKTKKWGMCGGSYTKISATGKELPNSATQWDCVLDNQTGLMWEKKTDSGLRDKKHIYTWFEDASGYADLRDWYIRHGWNLEYAKPYGYYCDNTLAKCNTKDFIKAVNSQKLCGYSDWRMPSKDELVVIGKKQDKGNFFDGVYGWYTWSGSPYAYDYYYAWSVGFGNGDSSDNHKGNNYHVRAVRSGQ